jgi:hypothetical protein
VVVLLKQSKIKSEKASYIKTTKKTQNWCKKPQFFSQENGHFFENF